MFSASVIVVLMMTVTKLASCEDYVYVKVKVPRLTCIESPYKDICPVDHKVPDFSADKKYTDISTTLIKNEMKRLPNIWMSRNLTVSEGCKDALRNRICTDASPVCKESEDYLVAKGQRSVDACNKVLQQCAGLPWVSKFFNCSSLKKQRVPRGLICKDLPRMANDPYPCAMGEYKYPESLVSNASHLEAIIAGHISLRLEQFKLGVTCQKNYADAICKIGFPACTNNRKYIVSFLTKEQCDTMRKCLNVPNIDPKLIKEAETWCNKLPDKNAMKLTLSDAFSNTPNGENTATTPSGGNSILILALFSFIRLLF